jgi:allantoinase
MKILWPFHKVQEWPITVETCPHYLTFAAEEIADGDTGFKCAPPIRQARHREELWAQLRIGGIATIGSDHSPCPPEMKHLESGDFLAAWGGISSLQLLLPTVWTGAAKRGISLEMVFDWLAAAPARLLRLETRKGSLVAGCDADLIVWDPDTRWKVDAQQLHHRHKVTPYDGRELAGRVHRTYVRGALVYEDGRFFGRPSGELLART